jgi:hypothetical protein
MDQIIGGVDILQLGDERRAFKEVDLNYGHIRVRINTIAGKPRSVADRTDDLAALFDQKTQKPLTDISVGPGQKNFHCL